MGIARGALRAGIAGAVLIPCAARADPPQPANVCPAGDALACERAGDERSGVRDYEHAIAFYEAACKAGRSKSCSHVGWFYNTGVGVSKSESAAFEWESRSCALNDASGCASVAILLANGLEIQRDVPRAQALALRWCNRGGALACDAYGRMLWKGGDPARATQFYAKACDAAASDREGYQGCTELAEAYRDGKGVSQDISKAVHFGAMACDGGMAKACNLLGWIYWEGKYVPKDAAAAVPLFRRACDGGDTYGCTNLGMLYLHGEEVPVDRKKAAELFQWSCDRGLDAACSNLKRMAAHRP